jgi:uncharacterized protein YuzB (UPF0349 family)
MRLRWSLFVSGSPYFYPQIDELGSAILDMSLGLAGGGTNRRDDPAMEAMESPCLIQNVTCIAMLCAYVGEAVVLGNDENVLSLFHDLVAPQLQAPV